MFQQSYRGTIVWLLIVGLALVLSLVAGGVPTAVGGILLATYAILVWTVTRHIPVRSVMESISARMVSDAEPTEVAREAAARARGYEDYDPLVRLLDIGLIVDEPRPDGMSLRRGRFISLDDDGIRPFAIAHVPTGLAERMGQVRFEIRDETDGIRYVYETEKWLVPGENVFLPDYRFPIKKNASDLSSGGWTARLMVDGGILGVHHFNVSASLASKRRMMSSDGEMRERVWRTTDDDESLPLSLEELLRQQSQQKRES